MSRAPFSGVVAAGFRGRSVSAAFFFRVSAKSADSARATMIAASPFGTW
jgi:hypothetical protein